MRWGRRITPSLLALVLPHLVPVACARPALHSLKMTARGQVLGPIWCKKKILNTPPPPAAVAAPATTEGDAPSDQQPAAASSSAVAQDLMTSIKTLYASWLTDDGSGVDYAGLAASPEYAAFKQRAQQLAGASVSDLPPPERKAFFLNVYNALVIHAMVELGTPRWLLARLTFYATAAYTIGGETYALNDIENGLLRGNRPSAAPLTSPPLPPGDPRLALCLELDPRIHFALNCGAASCPPIRHYSADALDAQLDLATRAFVNAQGTSEGGDALLLSQIFKWYAGDFGGSDGEVLAWVRTYLTRPEKVAAADKQLACTPVKLVYEAYDWSLNRKK